MNPKEPLYVVCRNGVFIIPETAFHSLSATVTRGFVYLRQDADTLTISSTYIADGRRRVLNTRFRANMFREATRLAIVDLKGTIQVMAVS
jgi:hypothetical protein